MFSYILVITVIAENQNILPKEINTTSLHTMVHKQQNSQLIEHKCLWIN